MYPVEHAPGPRRRALAQWPDGMSEDLRVVLEHAVLQVVPGKEDAFEEAFAVASKIIARSRAFRSLSLSRCVEEKSRYLLLVEWESLEDHVDGFRGSPPYQEWRRLLHHFYDPFPTVDHYQTRSTIS